MSITERPPLTWESEGSNDFIVRRGSRVLFRGDALSPAHAMELAELRETDLRVHRLAMRRHYADSARDREHFADGAAYGRAELAQRLRRALADNSGPALEAAIGALVELFGQVEVTE